MGSLRVCIDLLQTATTQPTGSGGLVVVQGESILCSGWAFSEGSADPNVTLGVLVDGQAADVGATSAARPDIAVNFRRPELANAGFQVRIPSHNLALGKHEFVLVFSDTNGSVARSEPLQFEVVAPVAIPRGATPRVLIAAAPKSGCTYVGLVLGRYYRVQASNATFFPYSEHMLSADVLSQLADKSWVMPMHIWPRAPNVLNIRKHRIATVVTWRNLADAIVSFDDHLKKEWGDVGGGPEVYLGKRDLWKAVPEQQRYGFLIRNLVPWYIGFYRAWRDAGAPIVMAYERLAVDPLGYFSYVIERLSGSVDSAWLEEVVSTSKRGAQSSNYTAARFNAGVNGRALAKMSGETKAMLEDTLKAHFDDLSELLAELPWRGGAVAAIEANPARWAPV